MENAKKMILVSPDQFENMRPKDESRASMSNIDAELQAILKGHQPADVKIKLYQQTLDKYIQQRNEYYAPLEFKVKADKPTTATLSGSSIASAVKPRYKEAAQLLVNHLEQHPRIGWNEKHELMVDERRVPDSNIFNLVQDFTTAGVGKSSSKPVGFEQFAQVLKETHVPRTAVTNYHRWRMIDDAAPTPRGRAVERAEPRRRNAADSQSGGKLLGSWQSYKM